MRRITLFATLFAAGCASTPAPPPQPEPVPVKPSPQLRGELIGLTAADLVQRLGTPALQVREGRSLKLQFRGAACVLDAYLYPPAGGGVERVAHIDARLRSGVDTDQRRCVAALGGL